MACRWHTGLAPSDASSASATASSRSASTSRRLSRQRISSTSRRSWSMQRLTSDARVERVPIDVRHRDPCDPLIDAAVRRLLYGLGVSAVRIHLRDHGGGDVGISVGSLPSGKQHDRTSGASHLRSGGFGQGRGVVGGTRSRGGGSDAAAVISAAPDASSAARRAASAACALDVRPLRSAPPRATHEVPGVWCAPADRPRPFPFRLPHMGGVGLARRGTFVNGTVERSGSGRGFLRYAAGLRSVANAPKSGSGRSDSNARPPERHFVPYPVQARHSCVHRPYGMSSCPPNTAPSGTGGGAWSSASRA
jgi:hypothetical protein